MPEPDRDRLLDEAVTIFLRLREAAADPAARRARDLFLARGPEARRAWGSVARAWGAAAPPPRRRSSSCSWRRSGHPRSGCSSRPTM